jgi:hypothetical protein
MMCLWRRHIPRNLRCSFANAVVVQAGGQLDGCARECESIAERPR